MNLGITNVGPLSQKDSCAGWSADLLLPPGHAGRRLHEPAAPSPAEQNPGGAREAKLTLWPPSLAAPNAHVQSWQHQPEKLIFESCGYEANYLSSMLIKDLRGTESHTGRLFQDAEIHGAHEEDPHHHPVHHVRRGQVHRRLQQEHHRGARDPEHCCATQDPEDLCTFAYITKDLQTSHHYCHVFSTVDVNLTYEIILTLGQAFKLAYQLALQSICVYIQRARQ